MNTYDIWSEKGDTDEPDENDYAESYCTLLEIAVEGRACDSVYVFMCESELIELPKSDNNNNICDVRPIASDDLMRKLISTFILQSLCNVPSDDRLSLDNYNNCR